MWALIGLFLTIGGTLIEAFITNAPWAWSQN
jgi:biotin transport system substrate-specific component